MSEQITSIIAAIEKAARGLRRNRPNYQSTGHVPACGWDIITTRNNRIETWTVHTDHQAGEAWYLLRRTVDGDVVEEFELRADHATVGNDGGCRRHASSPTALTAPRCP